LRTGSKGRARAIRREDARLAPLRDGSLARAGLRAQQVAVKISARRVLVAAGVHSSQHPRKEGYMLAR
jgi:hypothetical protein